MCSAKLEVPLLLLVGFCPGPLRLVSERSNAWMESAQGGQED